MLTTTFVGMLCLYVWFCLVVGFYPYTATKVEEEIEVEKRSMFVFKWRENELGEEAPIPGEGKKQAVPHGLQKDKLRFQTHCSQPN